MRNWGTFLLSSVLSVIVLSACGGGGGNSSAPSASSGTVSGTVIKGPVEGATVVAYGISGDGARGAQIGSGMTDSQGNFSFSVQEHSGPVLFEMSGGRYLDEATGLTMNTGQSDVLTCSIQALSPDGESGIQITPLTSMAQVIAEHMPGGMSAENITAANHALGQYFQVGDIVHTHPLNPLVAGSGTGVTQDVINYGMTMAAMSEYAHQINLNESSNIVTAFMQDAEDGHMDGMMGGSQINMGHNGGMMGGGMMLADAGTSGLANAMEQFIDSPFNMSGVTLADMQGLTDMLKTSNGVIQ